MEKKSRKLEKYTSNALRDECFFSQDGGRYACTYPQNRIKQAGDVETNPGPSCRVCERAIMAKHTSMPCVVCAAVAHGSCLGLSKVQRERGQEYRCENCGKVEGAEECGVCHRALRTNSSRLSYVECHGVAHGRCSGLSREALRRGDPYTCVRCRGVPLEALRGAEATGSQRCGVTLRRGGGLRLLWKLPPCDTQEMCQEDERRGGVDVLDL